MVCFILRIIPNWYREYQAYPEDPTPADGVSNETTDDRTKDRSTVRSSSEQGNRKATLVIIPNIGNGSACQYERRRREDTAEEPTDQESLNIGGDSTWNVED